MIRKEFWLYGLCDSCFKNAHEKVRMVREKIASGDTMASNSQDTWVCTKCGATKRL
jgi:hypothetical protein